MSLHYQNRPSSPWTKSVRRVAKETTETSCQLYPRAANSLVGAGVLVFLVGGCQSQAPALTSPITLRLVVGAGHAFLVDAGLQVTARLDRKPWAAPAPIRDNDKLEIRIQNTTNAIMVIGTVGTSGVEFATSVGYSETLSGRKCGPDEICRRTQLAGRSTDPVFYDMLGPGGSQTIGRLDIRRVRDGSYTVTPNHRGLEFPRGRFELPAKTYVFRPTYSLPAGWVPKNMGDKPAPWVGDLAGPTYELELP